MIFCTRASRSSGRLRFQAKLRNPDNAKVVSPAIRGLRRGNSKRCLPNPGEGSDAGRGTSNLIKYPVSIRFTSGSESSGVSRPIQK